MRWQTRQRLWEIALYVTMALVIAGLMVSAARGEERTLTWTESEPFECLDPPFSRSAPVGYRVYYNDSGDPCGGWYLIAEAAAPPVTYEEPEALPGEVHFVYVAAWNAAGESRRDDPTCLNPPREGIDPAPCP